MNANLLGVLPCSKNPYRRKGILTMSKGIISVAVQKSAFVDFRDRVIEKAFDIVSCEMVDRGAENIKWLTVTDGGDTVIFNYFVDEPVEEDPRQPYLFSLEEIAAS
jgi:hypothetical protein